MYHRKLLNAVSLHILQYARGVHVLPRSVWRRTQRWQWTTRGTYVVLELLRLACHACNNVQRNAYYMERSSTSDDRILLAVAKRCSNIFDWTRRTVFSSSSSIGGLTTYLQIFHVHQHRKDINREAVTHLKKAFARTPRPTGTSRLLDVCPRARCPLAHPMLFTSRG